VAAVEGGGGINRLAPEGPLRRAYFRAKERGTLTFWAADRLAVSLLCAHPVEVWGELWWDGHDQEERPEGVDDTGPFGPGPGTRPGALRARGAGARRPGPR
jgi:hypothetical protein